MTPDGPRDAPLAAAGAKPTDEEHGVGVVSVDLGAAALEAGIASWCDEHEALELADGVAADDVEAWVAARNSPG